tara:strand:- start:1400 stop:1624 length:225 start_codon:yes stop_codon:yes gene_type:complete
MVRRAPLNSSDSENILSKYGKIVAGCPNFCRLIAELSRMPAALHLPRRQELSSIVAANGKTRQPSSINAALIFC